MTPNQHFLTLGGHEIHVREWGAENAETVVLWHGLARTGADFTPLAELLAARWRCLAPDTLGRGLSQWAKAPEQDYSFARYERIALDLLDAFQVERLRWVGTSMGGALGIRLAAGPLKGRIERLVINDIGPELPQPAIDRILAYAGKPGSFDTLAQFEDYLKLIYRPYGWMSEDEWRRMAITSHRRRDDGRITLHYDPRMVLQFVHHGDDYRQWPAWSAIAAPVMVLRGKDSDLLLPEVAERMLAGNAGATLLEVEGCGHAPALNVLEQTGPVVAFLGG